MKTTNNYIIFGLVICSILISISYFQKGNDEFPKKVCDTLSIQTNDCYMLKKKMDLVDQNKKETNTFIDECMDLNYTRDKCILFGLAVLNQ